jgi:hypothetical protein
VDIAHKAISTQNGRYGMNDAGIHECFPFSDFKVLKPSPVELPGRGFDVLRGPAALFRWLLPSPV